MPAISILSVMMKVKVPRHGCPVCGFPDFDALDEFDCANFAICPCCGAESGYEYGAEAEEIHLRRLRWDWFVQRGGHWWGRTRKPPVGWDARAQLERAGFSIPTDDENG